MVAPNSKHPFLNMKTPVLLIQVPDVMVYEGRRGIEREERRGEREREREREMKGKQERRKSRVELT